MIAMLSPSEETITQGTDAVSNSNARGAEATRAKNFGDRVHTCALSPKFLLAGIKLLLRLARDGAPVRCASWLFRSSRLKAQSRQTGALTILPLPACCRNRRTGQGLCCPAWKRLQSTE